MRGRGMHAACRVPVGSLEVLIDVYYLPRENVDLSAYCEAFVFRIFGDDGFGVVVFAAVGIIDALTEADDVADMNVVPVV